MSRRPSPPPELPGFSYLEPLGTGGFADVFLYEQQMPRRRVAVKVLLADRIASASVQEFADEANVMAMLSTHPAIVTIYQAGVAGDGRPYLVMEYCPRPNLQMRSRKEPFSVAEALRVGIQVAGAVETAHRAGVLHRDIKPANILVTEYNRPALTDFGIASTTGAVSEATGMSIPWSPPESFADPPQSGLRSDVYALGATLYTLLSGRSPFERQGERNTGADLMERIERAPLPPLSRADVPGSLQRVLERSMAKKQDERYPSAVAFARALQKVQIELAHSVTPIDIVDEHPVAEAEEDDGDGLTRVRGVVSIEPDAGHTRPSATTRPSFGPAGPMFVAQSSAPDSVDETVRRADPSSEPDDDRTMLRGPQVVPAHATPPQLATTPSAPQTTEAPASPRSRRGLWIGLGSAAAVLAIVGGVIGLNAVVAQLNTQPDPQETAVEEKPQEVIPTAVPTVTELAGTRAGGDVTFTWTNPAPDDGDGYIVMQVSLSGESDPVTTEETTFTIQNAPAGEVCVDVLLRRSNGQASQPARGCVT
ncbi:protein kinase [Microbacterium sp. M28]|uniref:serine/threonine-protein kinase n=1 Tax=Microbacterium sp. M28 TaxID=2962064 RepID=UPI0021F3FFAC|nr:serine/threonine-protein kinase [Microbacterium sp. M28]UYO96691.1 protein kinase [Microbacterium sp. M28]